MLNQVRAQGHAYIEENLSYLYELLRHSLHVGETIAVTSESMGEMRQQQQALFPATSAKQDKQQQRRREETNNYMRFQTQIMRNLKLRQEATHRRLQTETTLVFIFLDTKCANSQASAC